MTDTSPETVKVQLEIMLSKSESERFRIGDELNAFGRKVLESSIRRDFTGISEIDLKIEVFRRCYVSFFSQDEIERIIISMKTYLQNDLLSS
jgi:hypothetical protein